MYNYLSWEVTQAEIHKHGQEKHPDEKYTMSDYVGIYKCWGLPNVAG